MYFETCIEAQNCLLRHGLNFAQSAYDGCAALRAVAPCGCLVPRRCREERSVSVEEENKAIARHFEEELSKGNLDIIDELLSPTSSTAA